MWKVAQGRIKSEHGEKSTKVAPNQFELIHGSVFFVIGRSALRRASVGFAQEIFPLVQWLGLTCLFLKNASLAGQSRFGLRGDGVQFFRARQLSG